MSRRMVLSVLVVLVFVGGIGLIVMNGGYEEGQNRGVNNDDFDSEGLPIKEGPMIWCKSAAIKTAFVAGNMVHSESINVSAVEVVVYNRSGDWSYNMGRLDFSAEGKPDRATLVKGDGLPTSNSQYIIELPFRLEHGSEYRFVFTFPGFEEGVKSAVCEVKQDWNGRW